MNTRQNELLESLKEDFSNMNSASSPEGGLINVGLIKATLNDTKQQIAEVNAHNETLDKVIKEQVKADFDKISPDIEALELLLKNNDNGIDIGWRLYESGNCKGSIHTSYKSICIHYMTESTKVCFKGGESVSKYHSPYLQIGYTGDTYPNIESLVSTKEFQEKIIEIINEKEAKN